MTGPTDGPRLPQERGALSKAVLAYLRGSGEAPAPAMADEADPYGEDLHLALYCCYELHYRGFADVDPAREWDPPLLAFRGALERRFETALRHDDPPGTGLTATLDALLVEPVRGTGVSHVLEESGTLERLRAYAVQRSLYHLKEADPHAWVLPRLSGRAKAGMAAIEYDEFGAGRAERVHAQLFADLMADLGLETTYGHYVDEGHAEMLALVNLMSLLGLHRRLRGALVGHFAAVEITSSPSSRRLALAMKRAEAGPAAEHFYTEHVEADAVHEQIVRHDVIRGLLDAEPELEADVVFGIEATGRLEDRLAARLLSDWGCAPPVGS